MGAARSQLHRHRCQCHCQCRCQWHQWCLHALLTLTIALTDSPIGWLAGLLGRKSGAAGSMARAAQAKELDAHPWARPAHLTIAMLASQIGWQGGAHPKRIGVATMQARAARLLQVAAPEIGKRKS